MREQLEAAIRERLEAHAPHLVGDLWGRERVTVLVSHLTVPLASGIVTGEAEALLQAETPDAFDLSAILRAFAEPVQRPKTATELGLRARLVRVHERIEAMTALCRLVFAVELTK